VLGGGGIAEATVLVEIQAIILIMVVATKAIKQQ
jgi:hypothetical protein